MRSRNRSQSGFTLIEAVMVIVITGIIAVLAAGFAKPLEGYFDTLNRADLSDTADTALRRMARDIRLALPNSVRMNTSGNSRYLDFLATTGGGRYRAELDAGTGTGDILDFIAADTSFDVLGPPVTIAAGDQIVVSNLGNPGADAYEGNTLSTHVRRAASVTGTVANVLMTSTNPLPHESPAQRFQIVHEQVRYICDLTTGRLTRYAGFPIAPPAAEVPDGGSSALLASGVTACSFTYAPGSAQRSGLVTISLTLSNNSDPLDNVTLLHQVHVQNVP